MKITKKDIFKIINENIEEMAMDFDTPDRPHSDVQQDLERGETPFKKVPLPKTDREPEQNFQELLASERYRQVIQNLRQYTGIQQPLRTMMDLMPLQAMMMTAYNQISQIESQHKEELENLAVRLVKDMYNISDDMIEFDAKLVGMGQIDTDDFNMDENDEEQQLEIEEDLLDTLDDIDLETAKRRFINSIIQGASKRGHYMYHMVSDELSQITNNPNLVNQYGILMSINDTLYWQLGNDMMKQMTGMVGGKESVERPEEENGKTKVIARGLNFPILVHELIKGTLEVVGTFGQTTDNEEYKEIIEKEDTLMKEIWDLRLGPIIWDRLYNIFPEESLMDNKELQLYILQAIFKLPAKNFFTFFKHVLSQSTEGQNMLNKMVDGIKKMLNDEDYTEEVEELQTDIQKSTDEMTEDELNKFLDDILKKRKKDNPEQ